MKTIEIQEILFSNTSSIVTCKGQLRQGNLSIHSSVQIDFSELNVLLNKICRIFGSEEIYKIMEEFETPEGHFFNLPLSGKYFMELSLDDFSEGMKHPFRICA